MPRQSLTARSETPPIIDSTPTIGLAWLVRLRWGILVTELAIVASARFVLEAEISYVAAIAVTGLTLATNLKLRSMTRQKGPASAALIAGVHVLDAVLLTVLLRASGGAMNPFSVLYLVHVALAALVLDRRITLLVGAATCVGFATLFSSSPSAHAHHHGGGASMEAHLRGMLVAYAVAACLVGYFVDRVARALERREREMIALRDYAARTEKLASLSTLAAGAAHELGSPLATIAVAAREIERAAGGAIDRASLEADARLVRDEAERCRQIIAKMASEAGEAQGGPPRRAAVGDVLARVRSGLGPARASAVELATPPPASFVVAPDDGLVQVLVDLVTNALEASAAAEKEPRVVLAAGVAGDRVSFRIEDRGPGIAPSALARLGEPFFTTKGNRGMGLGLFLARTFAERTSGTLDVETEVGTGTTFILTMPGGVA